MTFAGYLVLDWPEAVDSVTLTLKSKYNIIGDVWQKRELNVQHNPYTLLKFTFFQDNNEQRKQLRDFFAEIKGRHGRFWMRSYKNDLKLLKDVAFGDSILYCDNGFDLNALQEHKQFLYIVGHGTLYDIISIEEVYDNDLQQIVAAVHISPAAPFLLEKGCTLLEFAYLGRFDSDTLSFDFNDIWTSTASLPFREVSDKEMEELL